jgi:chloramphenicol O-acetyltransferase type A
LILQTFIYIKENNIPFLISGLYASTKTANSIKEFRYRMRKNKVIEHEFVSPSFTTITEGDVFSFCSAKFEEGRKIKLPL